MRCATGRERGSARCQMQKLTARKFHVRAPSLERLRANPCHLVIREIGPPRACTPRMCRPGSRVRRSFAKDP